MNKELLPCPFCGSIAFKQKSGASCKVVCSQCLCYQLALKMGDAVEKWNTRALPSHNSEYIQCSCIAGCEMCEDKRK